MPPTPEDADSTSPSVLENLVTQDQTQLLDLVNQLQNLGISRWIDLPQIIVVGAQSSGKSSVLEAISRIPFPRGDTLCTTFATEVNLVRDEANSINIRFRANPASSQARKDYLQQFTIDCENIEEVADVISTARTHLIGDELDEDVTENSFLEDTLCIECTDPSFPPLTLVDLPGLINVPNENQTDGDVEVVKNMVRTYMQNDKSIILAIVSAASDMSEHSILGLVRDVDPTGRRTLGIITKPDTLPDGSNSQRAFLRLAGNENTQWHLDLGWHVVRNRSYEERDSDLNERDRIEQRWFENSVWVNTMDRASVGIGSLRLRLAGLLERHTRRFLPEVVGEIRGHLKRCENDLKRLGPARETPREQRDYLITASEKFKNLVNMATEGRYGKREFFKSGDQQYRRIRAQVQVLNKAFAKVMQCCGHALGVGSARLQDLSSVPSTYLSAADSPASEDPASYLQKIRETINNSSGRELPGLFNPDVIQEVFVMKATKWDGIATAHVDEVWVVVKDALAAMASHDVNVETSQRIMRHVINDKLEQKRDRMNVKLKEILEPYMRCHPMTYDPDFEDDVQTGYGNSTQEDDSGEDEEEGLGVRQWTEKHALCYVEAYYDIALRRFVDNVAILVVEMCLLDELEDIFSPSVVSKMTDEQLKMIAGESPAVGGQRKQLTEKRDRLKTALRECLANGDASIEEPALRGNIIGDDAQSASQAGQHGHPPISNESAHSTSSAPGSGAVNTPDSDRQNGRSARPTAHTIANSPPPTANLQRPPSGQAMNSAPLFNSRLGQASQAPATTEISFEFGGGFGSASGPQNTSNAGGGLFGSSGGSTRTSVFSVQSNVTPGTGNGLGSASGTQNTGNSGGGLFGSNGGSASSAPFDLSNVRPATQAVFGSGSGSQNTSNAGGGLFGSNGGSTRTSVFGGFGTPSSVRPNTVGLSDQPS